MASLSLGEMFCRVSARGDFLRRPCCVDVLVSPVRSLRGDIVLLLHRCLRDIIDVHKRSQGDIDVVKLLFRRLRHA